MCVCVHTHNEDGISSYLQLYSSILALLLPASCLWSMVHNNQPKTVSGLVAPPQVAEERD